MLGYWHVIHTRPRREKKLATYCTVLGLSHYLPLRKETKIYQRRRVTVHKPVFPGYIFASFDFDQRSQLLRSGMVVRFLKPQKERHFLHELAQVRRALRVDPTLGATNALTRGRVVRITSGPFRGIEGKIDRLKGRMAVCLNVDLIGQAVQVEVERGLIEIVD